LRFTKPKHLTHGSLDRLLEALIMLFGNRRNDLLLLVEAEHAIALNIRTPAAIPKEPLFVVESTKNHARQLG